MVGGVVDDDGGVALLCSALLCSALLCSAPARLWLRTGQALFRHVNHGYTAFVFDTGFFPVCKILILAFPFWKDALP